MNSESTRYFDLQVNGYGGVDFNQDDLSADALHRACDLLERHGVGGILATIITEDLPRMAARLANLARLRSQDELARRIIAGLHIEGPFISPEAGYRGAHPADAVRPADTDAMKRLLDVGDGLVRLVTLAPECDPGNHVVAMLRKQNVTVSAGHSDASFDELRAATDAGLSLYTHLGNGCPMRGMDRHDNIIQRVLNLAAKGAITPCFIADGAHVTFFALENYLRHVGVDHAIVVTDAVAPAGLGPGTYNLSRWTLNIGPDLVARSPDGTHLVGAAVTMRQTEANLMTHVGLDAVACRRLLCENPRKAIGLSST